MENHLNHLAVIMDGNGRWAKMRGLDRSIGHREGLKKAEEVISWAIEKGVKYLTLYVFSTENWKRSEKEVKGLFKLAETYIDKFEKFTKNRIRVFVSGQSDGLPKKLAEKFKQIAKKTAEFDTINVNLLINYGGRQEIVSAVKKLQQQDIEVSEKTLATALYCDFPDPDLILRTGGQMRLSNFLLFQSAYAELYFSDTLWPDFSKEEFEKTLEIFSKRVRNFGG